MKPARILGPLAIAAVSSALGAVAGVAIADHHHNSERQAMIRENSTDRARICLEAAAMLRNDRPDRALGFLEAGTTDSIRGVRWVGHMPSFRRRAGCCSSVCSDTRGRYGASISRSIGWHAASPAITRG
jgi:hypothetical protein